MELVLAFVVFVTLFVSWRAHGLFSFVTLGVIGAAIYASPGIVDWERPFYVIGRGILYFQTPDAADKIYAIAWAGLLAGIVLFRPRGAQRNAHFHDFDPKVMLRLGLASCIMATAGLLYLLYTQGTGILIESRYDQVTDNILLVWKWTAPLGLLASTLGKSRKLMLFHALILFLIFLRGDRTLVAITAAAMMIAVTRDNPKWYLWLRPTRAIGLALAAIAVFFGKSVYNTLKTILGGEGYAMGLSLRDQFFVQFEPFGNYAHMDFVMRHDLHLSVFQFVVSVLSNLLIIPSFFGFSSNLYGQLILRTSPTGIGGMAGNYVANGYVVGGALGAFIFGLLLACILRLCDSRFNRSTGTWKLFWCCSGATFAFYVHRNGLDNMFSFIRQIGIACIVLAVIALVLAPAARRERTAPIVRPPMRQPPGEAQTAL